MFEEIIRQAQATAYDFRQTANLDDPLIDLFDRWLDYYKLKWAIAHVLQPTSILEIGVRFGYSAIAFLDASPQAHYLGIDLDTDTFGGVKGAINWAKKKTQGYDAEFLIADTQTMARFPGEVYDLIHVDGQQDGDGSFHDLEMAIKQGRYILFDGYLWTQANFLAASNFLFDHAEVLEFYGVIPGYAGDLLIKVSPDYLRAVNSPGLNQQSPLARRRSSITCVQSTGQPVQQASPNLTDPLLQAIAAIAGLPPQGRVLDLGCGQGELASYFAHQGLAVTTLHPVLPEGADRLEPASAIQILPDDSLDASLQGSYDLVLATDLVEYLTAEEVDRLYQQIAQVLTPTGLFVLHAFAPGWYARYEYPRRRRLATQIGAIMPPRPKGRYELLLPLQAQSPRSLKHQLGHYFHHTLVWAGDAADPQGSLARKATPSELRSSLNFFAVASHQPIATEEIVRCLQMQPLSGLVQQSLQLEVAQFPAVVAVGEEFEVLVALTNHTGLVLNSYGPNPVHLTYHWLDETAQTYLVYEGVRSKLFPPLGQRRECGRSGATPAATYPLRIRGLHVGGCYTLRVTLVQEAVQWFDQPPISLFQDISIRLI